MYPSPILTYSNRGTTKRGVRPEEHGVIYSQGDGREAKLLPGETGITKYSISVVMSTGVPPLHEAARIYYGVHHPVQYNVKVKEIGYVPKHEVHGLLANWKEETQKEDSVTPGAASVEVTEPRANNDDEDEDDEDEDEDEDNEDDDDVAEDADYMLNRGQQRPGKKLEPPGSSG
jgi:hypothetical protein